MIYYSKNKHACYDSALNYHSIPADAVEVSQDDYVKYWLSRAPKNLRLKTGQHPFVYEDAPLPTAEEWAAIEQAKMRIELEWCDLMLKYLNSNDTQRSGGLTINEVYAYAIKCRDHVISTDGVLSIVGAAPKRLTL
jgi:hypothetical protein